MKNIVIILFLALSANIFAQSGRILGGNKGNVNSIAFSPDSKTIVSGDEKGNIIFFDVSSGDKSFTLNTQSNITCVNYSVDGSGLLVYTSYEGDINIMNASTHEIKKNFSVDGNAYYAEFSNDGKLLAVAYTKEPTEKQQNQGIRINYIVDIYETGKFTKQKTLRMTKPNDDDGEMFGAKLFETYRFNSFNCSFSLKANYIATGTTGKNIAVYSFDYGKFLPEFKGHSKRVTYVTFSSDGTYMASTGKDENAKIWNVDNAGTILTLKGHSGTVNSASFSPDSKYLATCSNDETVKIWDVKSSALLKTLNDYKGEIYTVKFSPDGKYLAAGGSSENIIIWNAEDLVKTN